MRYAEVRFLNPAFLLDVLHELLLLGLALVVVESFQLPRVGSGHRFDSERRCARPCPPEWALRPPACLTYCSGKNVYLPVFVLRA